MAQWFVLTMTAALLSLSLTAPAGADAGQHTARQTPEQPPKDCTRFNSRYGYYGNPWCTPEEQERWDRWEVRRQRAAK